MTQQDLVSAFIQALSVSGITDKLIVTNGTIIIDDNVLHENLEGKSFIALTDTVFSLCQGKDSSNKDFNFMSESNWITVPAGVLIIAPTEYKINRITLASGSIALYK